jgi:hypothetical protein
LEGTTRSAHINVDGIFFDPVAAGDQSDDTADVATNVVNLTHREPVFEKSSDQPVFTQIDNVEIIYVVFFKVPVRTRSRPIKPIL